MVESKALRIPPDMFGQRRFNSRTPDSFFFERYLRQWEMMARILRVSGFGSMRHVVDFGSFVGGWSWVLSAEQFCEMTTALDVNDTALQLGAVFAESNGLSNIQFKKVSEDVLSALPTTDGIICLVTFQVMQAGGLHRFFEVARRIIKPGGLILCNSARPHMLLEWVFTLSRVRTDGWLAQLVWLRYVLRGLLMRHVDRTQAYYCLAPVAVVGLAREHGFRLKYSPAFYRHVPDTWALEASNAGDSHPLCRHYDWYLFEKMEEEPSS